MRGIILRAEPLRVNRGVIIPADARSGPGRCLLVRRAAKVDRDAAALAVPDEAAQVDVINTACLICPGLFRSRVLGVAGYQPQLTAGYRELPRRRLSLSLVSNSVSDAEQAESEPQLGLHAAAPVISHHEGHGPALFHKAAGAGRAAQQRLHTHRAHCRSTVGRASFAADAFKNRRMSLPRCS